MPDNPKKRRKEDRARTSQQDHEQRYERGKTRRTAKAQPKRSRSK